MTGPTELAASRPWRIWCRASPGSPWVCVSSHPDQASAYVALNRLCSRRAEPDWVVTFGDTAPGGGRTGGPKG